MKQVNHMTQAVQEMVAKEVTGPPKGKMKQV